MIAVADRVPEGDIYVMTEAGVKMQPMAPKLAGRKVVLFGLPGAFTGTCTSAHLPSFMRTAPGFASKGVEAIYCLSVNDAFVMDAWARATGADAAGVEMIADSTGALTRAMGLDFDGAPVGLLGRCQRFSALIEDGVVTQLNLEVQRGVCELSAGETLLEQI